MSQYHVVVNLDKQQYLHPCRLGDGQKLLEFGDGGATLTALAILLAKNNGRGIGDLHVALPDAPLESWERNGFKRIRTAHAHLVGSWAGDRIVIAGDYGEKLPDSEENNVSTDELLLRASTPEGGEDFADAVGELVMRYRTVVYSQALWICSGNRSLADDVFQETFLRLFTWLKGRKGRPPLHSFARLLQVFAKRAAIDVVRKENRQVLRR